MQQDSFLLLGPIGLLALLLVVIIIWALIKLLRSRSSGAAIALFVVIAGVVVLVGASMVFVTRSEVRRGDEWVPDGSAPSPITVSSDGGTVSVSSDQVIDSGDLPQPRPRVTLSPMESSPEPSFTSNGAYAYHVPDAFELWKRKCFKADFDEFALVAEQEGIPRWVLEASDSTPNQFHEIPGRLSIQSRFPGQRGRLAGYSNTLYESEAIAKQSAFQTGAMMLTASVLWALRDERLVSRSSEFHDARGLAMNAIYSRQETLELTSASRAVPLGAGVMYWSAVELDADRRTIESLAEHVRTGLLAMHQERAARRNYLITNVVSALGLALCTFLIYCFLNAGTKGHFAWPLRIISVGALLVVFALALLA